MIQSERFVRWMNVIRETQGDEQYRILESFWESQITSKQWIINIFNDLNMSCYGSVYIFGGWFGVLGGMLRDNYKNISTIYSIDIDPKVKEIGEAMNPDVTFINCDMQDINFKESPDLIINTSTEHISQETFDLWIKKIPEFIPIVLQGNNFFSCFEHIRCSESLEHFKQMNPLGQYLYSGELTCSGPNENYNRFMTIGYKNEITNV